jgi:hypothetical protein
MAAVSSQFNFIIGSGVIGTPPVSTSTSVAIPSASISVDGTTLFNSIPEKGDGYFGSADGMHTVTYTVTNNFEGSLGMQATLATNPTESDWFNVSNSTISYAYPIVPATTTTNYVNFTGNFVWVRAQVDRSINLPNGSVLFINYNH